MLPTEKPQPLPHLLYKRWFPKTSDSRLTNLYIEDSAFSLGWVDAAMACDLKGLERCNAPEIMRYRSQASKDTLFWKVKNQGLSVNNTDAPLLPVCDTNSVFVYGVLNNHHIAVFCHNPKWTDAIIGDPAYSGDIQGGLDYIWEVINNTVHRKRKKQTNIKLIKENAAPISRASFERILSLVPQGPCRFESDECNALFNSEWGYLLSEQYDAHPISLAVAGGDEKLREAYKQRCFEDRLPGYKVITLFHPVEMDINGYFLLSPVQFGDFYGNIIVGASFLDMGRFFGKHPPQQEIHSELSLEQKVIH